MGSKYSRVPNIAESPCIMCVQCIGGGGGGGWSVHLEISMHLGLYNVLGNIMSALGDVMICVGEYRECIGGGGGVQCIGRISVLISSQCT